MAAVEVFAFADMLGKQAQLAGGAAALAFQASGRQAGFFAADLGDGSAASLDFFGYGLEKDGALFTAGIAVGPERLFCRCAGLVDQGYRSDGKIMRLAGGGRGAEGGFRSDPFPGDEMLAVRLKRLVEHLRFLFAAFSHVR